MLQFDRSFSEHGSERPIYFGAISRYCEDFAIVGDARRRFMTFINAVDAEYLRFAHERIEAARKKQNKPGAANPQA